MTGMEQGIPIRTAENLAWVGTGLWQWAPQGFRNNVTLFNLYFCSFGSISVELCLLLSFLLSPSSRRWGYLDLEFAADGGKSLRRALIWRRVGGRGADVWGCGVMIIFLDV